MDCEEFYHIYNRGNNKEKIFFNRDNYLFFLRKIRSYIIPHFNLLSYCLMPNHFHMLVYTKDEFNLVECKKDLRIMLRSYSRAINIQERRTGSLFQQNTKLKKIDSKINSLKEAFNSDDLEFYPFICFHYIHQNPLKAKLVERMEDWEMSSYRDYAGIRNGTLCNKELASQLLDIPSSYELFIEQSLNVINSHVSLKL